MNHVLNAFFVPKNPLIPVVLLVKKDFAEYINRSPFFSGWQPIDTPEIIKGQTYIKYTTGVTEPGFREIIPTILKYIPNILVEEPIELQRAIANKLTEYQDLHK